MINTIRNEIDKQSYLKKTLPFNPINMYNAKLRFDINTFNNQSKETIMKKILLKMVRAIRGNKKIIAVIPFRGVIGVKKNGITIDQYSDLLEKAFKITGLKAVIMIINSPGGSPSQSEMIFKKIRRLSDKKKIPVIAFVEDIAASGGYYIAAAADEIISTENSIIGSIGVISHGFGFAKAIEKLGIERRVYSVGKSKALLDPFKPENPEDIEVIKAIQEDIFENFSNVVKGRRNNLIDDPDIFSGKVWSGVKAKEIGLIDDNNDLDGLIEEKFGKKIKIIKMSPKKRGFLSRLGLGDMINDILQELRWLR